MKSIDLHLSPALLPAVSFAVGIVAVMSYDADVYLPVALVIIAAFALLFRKRFALSEMMVFCYMFAAAGSTAALVGRPARLDLANREKCDRDGLVISVNSTASSSRLVVRCDDFDCLVYIIPPPSEDIKVGDIVLFQSRLDDPYSERKSTVYNDMSRKAALNLGASAVCNIGPDRIKVIGHAGSLASKFAQCRDNIVRLIVNSDLDHRSAAFVAAILVGDDSMLDSDMRDSFRSVGLAHCLALSGIHVGVVAALILALLMPLKFATGRYGRKVVLLLTLCGVWLYVALCGASASLVRAAVMLTVIIAGALFSRRTSPLNSLAVAALAILVASPRQLYSPGFQLSFVATASLIFFASRLNPFKHSKRRALKSLGAAGSASFAASTATAPVAAFHFGYIPVVSLLPNIVMAFVLPLIMASGLIIICLQGAGINSAWLTATVDGLYLPFDNACRKTAGSKFGEIDLYRLTACSGPTSDLIAVSDRHGGIDWLAREDRQWWLLAKHKSYYNEEQINSLEQRFKDFARHRNVENEPAVVKGDFKSGATARRGCLLVSAGVSVADISCPDITVLPDSVDYIVVTDNKTAAAVDSLVSATVVRQAVIVSSNVRGANHKILKEWCSRRNIRLIALNAGGFALADGVEQL